MAGLKGRNAHRSSVTGGREKSDQSGDASAGAVLATTSMSTGPVRYTR